MHLRVAPLATALLLTACGGGGGSSTPAAPPPPSGTLSVGACTVASGGATCSATVTWGSSNASGVVLRQGGADLASGASGSTAIDLDPDGTTIELRAGGVTLASTTASATCAAGSAWDGSTCAAWAERSVRWAPTPFSEEGAAIELEVVVYRPPGATGALPTALVHHGSTGDGSDPTLFGRTVVHEPLARFLVERGWLVAFAQRRGRGRSGGTYDEGFNAARTFYSCDAAEALPGVERALADLDAVLAWAGGEADVDPARLLAAGISRGGVLALVHAKRQPGAFRGALNVVGGWLGEGCPGDGGVNRTLFTEAGEGAGSTLWLYAEDDSFYSVPFSRGLHGDFVAAGGRGDFLVYTRAPGRNGHFLANDPELWGDDVDAWLATLP